jgi:hypothetical protein
MSWLRSCYTTKARFFHDSVAVDDIIWYWCEAGAAEFPEGNVFTTLNYTSGGTLYHSGVGEQPSFPRPWRDGSIPVAPPSQVVDGELRWFQKGQSVSDPGLVRTAFGIPVNCTSGFVLCSGSGLGHFTWRVRYPHSRVLGDTIEVNPNLAHVPLPPPDLGAVDINCDVPVFAPLPSQLWVRIAPFGFPPLYFLDPVLSGAGPEYSLRMYDIPHDPSTDVFITFEPGP